jgi:hypothetical protein
VGPRGKIVLLGTDIEVLNFYHYLEEAFEAQLPVKPFTTEVFTLACRCEDGSLVQSRCRLYEPAVSQRRRLVQLVPFARSVGAWHEARVGRLPVIVLDARGVEAALREMIRQSKSCYE